MFVEVWDEKQALWKVVVDEVLLKPAGLLLFYETKLFFFGFNSNASGEGDFLKCCSKIPNYFKAIYYLMPFNCT